MKIVHARILTPKRNARGYLICPRDGTKLTYESDRYGTFYACLPCGYTWEGNLTTL